MGARKSYNPKNKGKKSYQPILTFIAETREYLWGELRNGDRPTGKQVYEHLKLRDSRSSQRRPRDIRAGGFWFFTVPKLSRLTKRETVDS